MVEVDAEKRGVNLGILRVKIDVGKLVGIDGRTDEVRVTDARVDVGAVEVEERLRVEVALLERLQVVEEGLVIGIVRLHKVHVARVQEHEVGVPVTDLLEVDVYCGFLARLVGNVFRAYLGKRGVVRVRTGEALSALIIDCAHVDARLVGIGDVGSARLQVGVPFLELRDDFLRMVLRAQGLADAGDRGVYVVGEQLVLVGDADDGDARVRLERVALFSAAARDDHVRCELHKLLLVDVRLKQMVSITRRRQVGEKILVHHRVRTV